MRDGPHRPKRRGPPWLPRTRHSVDSGAILSCATTCLTPPRRLDRRAFLSRAARSTALLGALPALPLEWPTEVLEAFSPSPQDSERELPDWPYFQSDGEPLTGYQQLRDVRALFAEFINASTDEVALTLNATMGMSFLANGLDLSAGDDVVTTNMEHSGGIGGWQLRARRHGVNAPVRPVKYSRSIDRIRCKCPPIPPHPAALRGCAGVRAGGEPRRSSTR